MEKLFCILGLTLVLSVGCNRNGPVDIDVAPPTMEVLSFIPIPMQDEICGGVEPTVFQLTGGDELSFNAIFEDNDALSQYKVDIHNNFDCHGHGGGSAPDVLVPSVENQTEDWSVLEIKNISGTSATENPTFEVPENVTAGNYHFHIQVLDESGNDNPFSNFFSLKIKNPLDDVPPQIEMQAPLSSSFSANKGESIRFVGKVTDDRSLSDGANGVLYLAYTDLSSGNTFATDMVFPFDASVEKEFQFDFEYVVPNFLTDGSYRLSLGANDGVRNVAPFVFFEVEVN